MTDVITGTECYISEDATVGPVGSRHGDPAVVGDNATIRSGTILYPDVEVGDGFRTGHHVLVRSGTRVGDDVLVGSQTVVDGNADIGSHVSLQTGVYVPPETTVGDQVFVGPGAVVTNDAYPIRTEDDLEGTTIEAHVSIGANATILPGVTVGEGSFVAAGAVVPEDVPPNTLAVGVPAKHRSLPAQLQGGNRLA